MTWLLLTLALAADRVSALEGRISIAFDEAVVEETEHGIGGFLHSSRFVLEPPAQPDELFAFPSFVLTVEDLYRTSTDDVVADAARYWLSKAEVTPHKRRKDLAWLRDDSTWNGSAPRLAAGAVMALKDGSLVKITARLGPAVPVADVGSYRTRAEAMIESIRMTKPRSKTKAGPAALPSGLQIDLVPEVLLSCDDTAPTVTQCALRSVSGTWGIVLLSFLPSATRTVDLSPADAAIREVSILEETREARLTLGDTRMLRVPPVRVSGDRMLKISITTSSSDAEDAWLALLETLRAEP